VHLFTGKKISKYPLNYTYFKNIKEKRGKKINNHLSDILITFYPPTQNPMISFLKNRDVKEGSEGKMIEECDFKSKIRHLESPICNLTPQDIVCPGEENCILYQIYYNTKKNK